MNPLLKPLWAIYYWLIFVPLFVLATILTSILTVLGSALGWRRGATYLPSRIWSKLTMNLLFSPVTVRGKEHIPDEAVIVAPNHMSALDVFVMAGYLHMPCRWVLKAPIRKIPFVGWACERIGFIFVDHTPSGARRVISDAKATIAEDFSILIFPEGTRSTTGRVGRLRKGVASIAISTGTPVLPVTIDGTFEALPKDHYFVHPHRITMTIHPLIRTTRYSNDAEGMIRLTDDLTAAIKSGM